MMHRQGFSSSIGQSLESAQRQLGSPNDPYTADVIRQRANTFASKRYGISLSPRQLRRLVDSGLVPGPKPYGRRRGLPPEWRWSPLSYRRVLQVCRLRKRGVRRTSAILFNLWLDGAGYQFSAVRAAARSEFRRSRKAISQRIPTAWDPRVEGAGLAPRSRAAVLRGLGSEQSAFPALPPDVVLQLASTMLFGAQMDRDEMFEIFPAYGFPKALIDELQRDDGVLSDLDLGGGVLAGLTADPEESDLTAEAALEDADEETFTNIRHFIREAPWMYSLLPALVAIFYPQAEAESAVLRDVYVNLTKMLHDPACRLLHFVFMLRRAQLKGDHGRGAGAFARLVLSPLRRLIVFVASDLETQALVQQVAKAVGIEQETPLPVVLSMFLAKRDDPALRSITRKLIRITWQHGLSGLWKLLKPPKNNVRRA